MGLNDSVSKGRGRRWLRAAVLALVLVSAPVGATGTDSDLPGTRELAAALSDPGLRTETLLTLVALQNLADYGRFARAHEVEEYVLRFQEERAWLERLSERYPVVPLRSSLMDPAAWLLLLELDQYDLSPGPAVSPFGPGTGELLGALFDTSNEAAAATILPELLSRVEFESASLWRRVLEQAETNVALARVLAELSEEWFDLWAAAEPPAPVALDPEPGIEAVLALFEAAAGMALRDGPPDALDLKRLRFQLLTRMQDLSWQEANDAAYLLGLANAVESLYLGRYLAFNETMLWVAAGLLASELPDSEPPEQAHGSGPFPPLPPIELEPLPGEFVPPPPYRSRLPDVLTDLLPALSQSFSSDFDRVDPRLNIVLASVFDVVHYIRSGQGDPNQLSSLRFALADAVAQLTLLAPDMDYYFSQPVRVDIAEEINICISLSSSREQQNEFPLSREEFDRCIHGLASLASTGVSKTELAGDPDGPFGLEQLQRELDLSPWQRINFVLGYLLDTHDTGCAPPEQALPNPLEWASIVTVMTWLARQSPVYFQSPENEILVNGLRSQGRELLSSLARQVDCIAGSGGGLNDPLVRTLADYRDDFEALVEGMREEELAFREQRLAAGADIVLSDGAAQRTGYRPQGLAIGPCDPTTACEMVGSLDPGERLLDLFPEVYRVAEQAGMGTIGLCYDNVRWVDRRAEPVREDDPHVANYHGRFSFDLFGTFDDGGEKRRVFGYRFSSPDEYHYLFGPSGEEVLDAACPMEWVGTRIVTGLGDRTAIRVVPDRLTYLAAARNLPSTLFAANWTRNQQWRDAFPDGPGVEGLELEPDAGFTQRLSLYLEGLYRAEQAAVYTALLNPPPRSWRGVPSSLHGTLREVDTRKELLRAQLSLFYPLTQLDSDEIRSLLEGVAGLPDTQSVRAARRENVPVSSIAATGLERVESMRGAWSRQPEAVRRMGSAAISLVHAIVRLDALHRDFFEPPAEPPQPVSDRSLLDFEELGG
jgi:hypothetical protein